MSVASSTNVNSNTNSGASRRPAVKFNPLARSVSGTEAPISNRIRGQPAYFSTNTNYPANQTFQGTPRTNLWTTAQNNANARVSTENPKYRRGNPYNSIVRARELHKEETTAAPETVPVVQENSRWGKFKKWVSSPRTWFKGGSRTRRKVRKSRGKKTRGKRV